MTRYKMSNNEKVQMSSAEEAEVDTFQQAHIDAQPATYMVELRIVRDRLLAETDWMSYSDSSDMSNAWRTYRQALRDITSQTPNDIGLSNITFPTKPS
jgi:hypothetical protein|tara:strand:+ start:521 stop:814 length:294 start_codon:yes stop_codon:yes gene_type:complete